MAFKCIHAAFAASLLAASVPASAQTIEDLDALSDQTDDEQTGIALAQEQIARGELLIALATLERVLTRYPKSSEARFNHALLLCWVDDPQGALVEFERLDEDDYAPDALKKAIENCRISKGEVEQ